MKRKTTEPYTGKPKVTTPKSVLPNSRLYIFLLFLVLLSATILRIYEFRGFGAVDDAAYAQIAHKVSEGSFTAGSYKGPAAFPLRVGIIYPTALLFRHIGVSEWSMVFFPFLISLLSVLLAYICTNYFFGPRAALIAAAIWGFLPLDAFHATILSPDLPAAFFGSLAVIIILHIVDSNIQNKFFLFGGGIAAGVSFGLSWLCKESVAYMVPFCAFLMISTLNKNWKRNLPTWIGVAVGSVGVLSVEMFVYYKATGDWLFHFKETERNYTQYKNAFFVEGAKFTGLGAGGHFKAILRRLLLDGPLTIFFNVQLLYLPLIGAIICLHALYWRNKSLLVPCIWFATLVLMYNFSSSSLKAYAPIVLFDRYLYPVLLPAVVVTAAFLENLFFHRKEDLNGMVHREKVFWGSLVLVFLVLLCGYKNFSNRKWSPGWVSEVKTVSRLLKPSDKLYTDILSIHGLEFFWDYPGKMNTEDFEEMEPAVAIPPGSYVLINQRYLNWLTDKAGWWPTQSGDYRKPEFHNRIPSSWKKIWGNETTALYHVA
jgi:4-amino-4-deoxy-L-arabinose transferase-like glycosyltransferase